MASMLLRMNGLAAAAGVAAGAVASGWATGCEIVRTAGVRGAAAGDCLACGSATAPSAGGNWGRSTALVGWAEPNAGGRLGSVIGEASPVVGSIARIALSASCAICSADCRASLEGLCSAASVDAPPSEARPRVATNRAVRMMRVIQVIMPCLSHEGQCAAAPMSLQGTPWPGVLIPRRRQSIR